MTIKRKCAWGVSSLIAAAGITAIAVKFGLAVLAFFSIPLGMILFTHFMIWLWD